MADCIAWENVLIYNYSFCKTNIREIGSRNTLEERMDKVSGISDIHHFYDHMDAGGRSEFTGGTWKNPYSVGIFTGRTQCFYLWIAL